MNLKTWHKIADSIDARSGRERLLLTSVIVIILYITAFYIIQPKLIEKQIIAGNDINTYQSLTAKRSLAIHQIVTDQKNDTNTSMLQNIQRLKEKIKKIETNGGDLSNSFVDPEEMTAFIKSILREQKLRILRLENSPPETIASKNKNGADIYKHDLYIEISGRYQDHIRFLKKLEGLPWNIFWSELHLRADKPGKSTVSLALYTLNFNPAWLEI